MGGGIPLGERYWCKQKLSKEIIKLKIFQAIQIDSNQVHLDSGGNLLIVVY